jgi:hypothetical protein
MSQLEARNSAPAPETSSERKERTMSGDFVTRFFGGSPAGVLLRLVVISFVVGIILNALGVSPFDIINGLRELAWRIYMLGFDSIEWIFRYFLLGAVIVFPIWLIVRLLKVARR